jgi:hypothetical protein
MVAVLLACHGGGRAPEPADATAATTDTAQENGIVVAALEPASHASTSVIGYATVVDSSELFSAAAQYAAADAQRRQLAAQVDVSRVALERQRLLNADDKNVSDRAVQEAAATATANVAAMQASEASLAAIRIAARQRWGATLASGAIGQVAWARSLQNGEAALLEVAFIGEGATPPATIVVRSGGGGERAARFLGASPRADARLRHPAFDYLVSPAAEFPIGLSIEVQGRSTAAAAGVLVPARAVVWDSGVATVFVEERAREFTPRPISAAIRAEEGFIERNLAVGTRVVVQGAQQLLSARHKPAAE